LGGEANIQGGSVPRGAHAACAAFPGRRADTAHCWQEGWQRNRLPRDLTTDPQRGMSRSAGRLVVLPPRLCLLDAALQGSGFCTALRTPKPERATSCARGDVVLQGTFADPWVRLGWDRTGQFGRQVVSNKRPPYRGAHTGGPGFSRITATGHCTKIVRLRGRRADTIAAKAVKTGRTWLLNVLRPHEVGGPLSRE